MNIRLDNSFFERDVLRVAPDLVGKCIVLSQKRGIVSRHVITETEAYRGEEDRACHASRGRTARTEIMYSSGGHVYIYLIYGMYWMFNIVTGGVDRPEAVLIRGIEGFDGPGKLTRELGIDKTFYGVNLSLSDKIWIEENPGGRRNIITTPRIGIDYAGSPWKEKKWRYLAVD